MEIKRRKYLPEKSFYTSPTSVQAWLRLIKNGPYKNSERSKAALEAALRRILRLIRTAEVQVVSLGPGEGTKDRLLIQALKGKGIRVSYLAIDTSRPLLSMALKKVDACRVPSQGWMADITQKNLVDRLRNRPPAPRLFLLVGNTLGGFDSISMSKRVSQMMHKGDFLLVDGEIYAGEETLKGYDNPVNRRFAWAPLKGLGITEDDGVLHFEIRKDPRLGGLYFVQKYFIPHRKGGRIRMSPSYKYSKGAFHHLIEKKAGLRPLAEFLSPDRRLLMIFAQK